MKEIEISNRKIGPNHKPLLIAEIGINHNGNLDIARKLIKASKESGANAVKFQKRTSELCVPKDQWDIKRDTPWGEMRYIDYRHKVEFNEAEYKEIDAIFCVGELSPER